MTSRKEIVKHFFDEVVKNTQPRWCTAERCACLGCVNGGWRRKYSEQWKQVNGELEYLAEDDVKEYLKDNPPPKSKWEYDFRSFKL